MRQCLHCFNCVAGGTKNAYYIRPRRRWRDDIDTFLDDWSKIALHWELWKARGEACTPQWDTNTVLVASSQSISAKLDFDELESSSITPDTSQAKDDDVEVKHTIVVSTKLKNNNRRGLHSSSDDSGTLTYNIGRTANKEEESSEVPIVYGLKSVESTQIRTPDSRFKNRVYPDAVFINRNIRDDYDHYPNSATNPMAWKPSNFFNNINWRAPGSGNQVYNPRANNVPTAKFHRKITDDGMKEFYCKKCREFSHGSVQAGQVTRGCGQSRNAWIYQTTTPKMKIDGKLAKLN